MTRKLQHLVHLTALPDAHILRMVERRYALAWVTYVC